MGYGPVPLSARRGLPRSTVVLAVVCLLLAVALAVVLLQRTAPTTGPAAPSQTPTPGPTASAASPTPTASPTSSPETTPGSDASERADEPAGVRTAATQFIRAWQEPSADVRVPMMSEVATDSLTEQLSDVDPAKISKAKPVGDLVVVQASDYAANADQRLSDKTTVRMQLVYEPASRYGWLVDTIVPLR